MADDKVSEEPMISEVVMNLLIVEGIAMVISNMLVIIPIIREKRLRKVNFLPLMSLALADTTNGVVIIVAVLNVTYKNFIRITTGFMIFGQAASILSIMVVCTDRWVAIFQPLRYRALLHSRRLFAMTFSAWVIAAIVSIPVGFFDKFEYIFKSSAIPKNERTYIIVLCSMFICICAILGFIQFRIIFTVRRHLKRILPITEISVGPVPSGTSYLDQDSRGSMQSNGPKTPRRYFKQREIALAVATNCVYLLIIITSSPFLVVTLLLLSNDCPSGCEKILPFMVMLLHINSFINPIIYAVRLREFKSAINSLFCSLKCCQTH